MEEDEEYREAATYLKHHQFIRVIEELEQLVVQRLFELAKANLMATVAVHNAVDKYNAMAPLQDPPCQLLEYSAVAAYSWLGEFDLLKESRYEVLQRPWAIPLYREIASKYYKIVHAREELPLLAMAIRAQHGQQRRVNNVHQARLQTIYRLSGYSGHTTPRTRKGGIQEDNTGRERSFLTLENEAVHYTDVMENMTFSWQLK
ncbi:hypothetical protein K439DRAFT_1644436 [Ramaria rubella]|nr:hypothetical protein K439DRAFT_1644436 [Ramaria rubella]